MSDSPLTTPGRPLEALIDQMRDPQFRLRLIATNPDVGCVPEALVDRWADELAALLQAAAPPAPTAEPPAKVKQAVFLYLNALVITSDNIGDIRRSLFMPFDCKWNGWVRDMTAQLENKSSAPVAPPERVSEGKP